jgi:hypothetical protein
MNNYHKYLKYKNNFLYFKLLLGDSSSTNILDDKEKLINALVNLSL